jgi:hypothetical protein
MKKGSNKKTSSKGRKIKNVFENVDVNEERSKIDLAFESAMLEMSFENISGLLKTFGIPSPQAKKIKQQAKLIAMFNQKMIQSGHPEQVISMGEKILPWILKISTAEMFLEPLGKWLIEVAGKKKHTGIVEKTKSMRG